MTVTRPYRSPARQARRQHTKQAIVEAFIAQLGDPGRATLSPAAAARAAGVSIRTVHHYFPDADAQLTAVADEVRGTAVPGPAPAAPHARRAAGPGHGRLPGRRRPAAPAARPGPQQPRSTGPRPPPGRTADSDQERAGGHRRRPGRNPPRRRRGVLAGQRRRRDSAGRPVRAHPRTGRPRLRPDNPLHHRQPHRPGHHGPAHTIPPVTPGRPPGPASSPRVRPGNAPGHANSHRAAAHRAQHTQTCAGSVLMGIKPTLAPNGGSRALDVTMGNPQR